MQFGMEQADFTECICQEVNVHIVHQDLQIAWAWAW
jgi:hypothetical protein